VGKDVPFKVVDTDKRDPEAESESLAVREADKERPDKSRAVGSSNKRYIAHRDPGLFERFPDQARKLAQVVAGGNLRDDPTIAGVKPCLGVDKVGDKIRLSLKNGHGGLIAGGLYSQCVKRGVHEKPPLYALKPASVRKVLRKKAVASGLVPDVPSECATFLAMRHSATSNCSIRTNSVYL
jgi:hypothetical protein